MELTKKQVIDKILAFSYAELAEWIKARLNGDDKYFPVYLGHEPNLSEFLHDVFKNIKDEKFRDKFLEILTDLTSQLRVLSKNQIEESKEYIKELLFLCGNIKQFENKNVLLEIAVSGRFKGVKIGSSDLHAKLLTTLASYKMAGTSKFWIDQLLDDSNKRYANPAFYALKDYPDRLFEHIGAFIDKYKGESELVLGIMSLINEYGRNEIYKRFKGIESNLSFEQKEAVNQALGKADCDVVYKSNETVHKEYQYTPKAPKLQHVSAPTPAYEADAASGIVSTLQEAEKLLSSMTREEKEQVLQWVVRDLGGAFPGIESNPGICGGEPCIVRTRIPVWVLVQAKRLGKTEADLLQAYPTLRAEDLANAWAYARSHLEEIQQQIHENENA
jgi:uncharacterized protein (DUF433 family)